MSTLIVEDNANVLLQEWKQAINRSITMGVEVEQKSLANYAEMLSGLISLGGTICRDGDMLQGRNDFIGFGVVCRRLGNGVLDFTIHS